MFKKKLFALALIVGLALPIAAQAKEEKEKWPDKPINIGLPHEVVSTMPKHKAMLIFQKKIQEAFPGKVILKVFPNSQLMSDSQALDGCRTGAVEMAFPLWSRFAKYDKRTAVIGMPYLMPNYESKWAMLNSDLARLLVKLIGDNGFHVYGMALNGVSCVASKTRILTASDYSGKKIRVYDATCQIAGLAKLGASSYTMPASEYTAALETGVIDAIMTGASSWDGTLRTTAEFATFAGMFNGAVL